MAIKGQPGDPCGGGNLDLNSTNINFLAVIFYFSFARCYQRTELGKGHKGSLYYFNSM